MKIVAIFILYISIKIQQIIVNVHIKEKINLNLSWHICLKIDKLKYLKSIINCTVSSICINQISFIHCTIHITFMSFHMSILTKLLV